MKRNYLKLIIIIIVTVILTISFSNLYKNYEKNKLNDGYISKYVSIINYNELTSALTEINSDTLLYISFVNNKGVYNLEKKIKKILKTNDLEDNFFFVDATNYIDNESKLNNEDLVLPAILYYKDGAFMDHIDSKNGMIDISKFELLLERNELGRYNK